MQHETWTCVWAVGMLLARALGDNSFSPCSEGQSSQPLRVDNGNTDVSIFDDLTQSEMQAVIDYLVENEGVVRHQEQATPDSSYIFLIEGLPPAKAEAVTYLAGTGARPHRYAKVILYRGDKTPPSISEVKVGPLPSPTSHEVMTRPGWRNSTLPYHLRSFMSEVEAPLLDIFLSRELARVDDMLRIETGYSYSNCSRHCLRWLPSTPGSVHKSSSLRILWVSLVRMVEGPFLHPIGLQLKIDIASTNVEHWSILHVWFKGEYYPDLNDMLTRYSPSGKPPTLYDTDDPLLFSSLKQKGDPLPRQPQRGPQQVLPDGPRWTVDGHHVDWQGWSFEFNMRSSLGTQMHDVKFQGHKVAYEVSLSEVGIMYSGHSPFPLHTSYLDSIFPLGQAMHVVIPGADCPTYATYFDFVHYIGFGPHIYRNAACVFEWNTGTPLRRHYDNLQNTDGSYSSYQTMPDNVLILRSMLTVGNYEYLLDYIFHQNGVLEVKCSLSGYVLSSYFSGPHENRYGFEIFPDGIASIHNHLVQFKIDLDVDGSSNRFESLDVSVEKVPDVTEPQGSTIHARTITRTLRRTESEGAVNLDSRHPKYLLMVNNNSTSAYGNKRAYRIIPKDTTTVLLPRGKDVEEAFSWARYQVAVTRQRDTEVSGSTTYATMTQLDPLFTFQGYIDDNEDIVDQDLVAWVTLGALHIPHSEDVPIVQTPGVQLGLLLQPYNFFRDDPSQRSRDNLRSTPGKDGGHDFQYVGVHPGTECGAKTSAASTPSGSVLVVAYVALLSVVVLM